MTTAFYEHTAYRLSEQPVPACFVELDRQLAGQVAASQDNPLHVGRVLAESICARMADVEMYAYLIEDARRRQSLAPSEMDHQSDLKAAVLTRSFLVGYLGAARGLLDSGAVALATLYELPLSGAACTFGNPDFWLAFVQTVPNIHRRYHPLRLFFGQVYQWSNEMTQRIAPVIVIEHHYGRFSRRDTLTQVLDDGTINPNELAQEGIGRNWIDPVQLHGRWKPELLMLCEKLCHDISKAL